MSTMPPFYEKLILGIYTYATVRSYLDDLLEVLDVPDVLRAVDPALVAVVGSPPLCHVGDDATTLHRLTHEDCDKDSNLNTQSQIKMLFLTH